LQKGTEFKIKLFVLELLK